MTSVVSIIPFTYKEAKAAAIIRAELEKAGTAVSANYVLVTHNIKEFSKVESFRLEDLL